MRGEGAGMPGCRVGEFPLFTPEYGGVSRSRPSPGGNPGPLNLPRPTPFLPNPPP